MLGSVACTGTPVGRDEDVLVGKRQLLVGLHPHRKNGDRRQTDDLLRDTSEKISCHSLPAVCWHHDPVVIVTLGILDDRRRWIPLDDIGIVVSSERAQCLLCFLDDVLALLGECVDDFGFDDGDAISCRIRDKEDVDGTVGSVCNFGGVM